MAESNHAKNQRREGRRRAQAPGLEPESRVGDLGPTGQSPKPNLGTGSLPSPLLATPSRLAVAAALPVKPSHSVIEKAYVRGLKEGMRRGEARRQEITAAKNELGIRFKTAVGEIRRLKLALKTQHNEV